MTDFFITWLKGTISANSKTQIYSPKAVNLIKD